MATRECINCKRVMRIQGGGLCGGCYGASKGLEGKEKDLALAAAAERLQDPQFRPVPAASKATNENQQKVATLPVTFIGEDYRIYDELVAEARRNRRNPEQQLLYILEHQLQGVVNG